jgi:hypothetical protein
MSDHLDRDTVERLLRGEDTGPPRLAALLTAASARPLRDDRHGEDIAVTAFREGRSGDRTASRSPHRLPGSRLLTVKAAVAGFVFVLAGGVAVAASPHLSQPSGGKHTPARRTPVTSPSPAGHQIVPAPAQSSPHGPGKARAQHAGGHHHARPGHGQRPASDGRPEVHPPGGKPRLRITHPPNGHWPPPVDVPPRLEAPSRVIAPPLPQVPAQGDA